MKTPDPAEVEAAEAALVPADRESFARAMEEFVAFAELFGLPLSRLEETVRLYHHALSDLPADLIEAAVRRTVADWRFSGRLPLPKDLRATVAEDLAKRRQRLGTLYAARQRAESVARNQDLVARMREKTLARLNLSDADSPHHHGDDT